MKKIVLLMLIIFAVLVSCGKKGEVKNVDAGNNLATEKVSENKFRDFTVTTKDGEFTLYKSKKPVLVNVWATWWGSCEEEMPALQKLYNEYKDKVDFIFIESGEEIVDVDDFIASNNYNFPVAYDVNQSFSTNFAIEGFPATFILDKDKNLISTLLGSRDYDEFKSELDKVLK